MKILIIAPHPDDEVLGCGGTIAKHAASGNEVYVCIVTKGAEPLFSEEQVERVREECRKANNILGVKGIEFLDFPAAMLEEVPRYKLNDAISNVIQNVKPDEVYIPHRGDMQLDHKLIVDAAMVALRPKYEHVVKRIYSYETPSETGWDVPNETNAFIPNVYNNISRFIEMKVKALECYNSQLGVYPNPRSVKAVGALAMYRGSTVNVEYAEAFELAREIK